MVTYHQISTKDELLDMIGAGNPNPLAIGPKVVEGTLWDGRKVSAAYYKKGPKWLHPDASTLEEIFMSLKPLVPLVDRLLENGKSFVTMMGASDTVCCLEWTIEAKK